MPKLTLIALLATACINGWAAPQANRAPSGAEGETEVMSTQGLSAVAKILIRSQPSAAFAAFADADQMSKFWFTRRDGGLVAGEPSTWYIGSEADAYSFDVRVLEVDHSRKIVIEWENGGEYTQVSWTFDETDEGHTILTIEESGFSGSSQSIIDRVVDSTGGFNQVIVAAKALVEHGVALSVVDDHA